MPNQTSINPEFFRFHIAAHLGERITLSLQSRPTHPILSSIEKQNHDH